MFSTQKNCTAQNNAIQENNEQLKRKLTIINRHQQNKNEELTIYPDGSIDNLKLDVCEHKKKGTFLSNNDNILNVYCKECDKIKKINNKLISELPTIDTKNNLEVIKYILQNNEKLHLINNIAGWGKTFAIDFIHKNYENLNAVNICGTERAGGIWTNIKNLLNETRTDQHGRRELSIYREHFNLNDIILSDENWDHFLEKVKDNKFFKLLTNMDVLIIDEFSRVSKGELKRIDYLLRATKRRDEPYGGVKMILMGDLQQSRGRAYELSCIEYIMNQDFIIYNSNHSRRFKTEQFSNLMTDARINEVDEKGIELLKTRIFNEEKINKKIASGEIKQVVYYMKGDLYKRHDILNKYSTKIIRAGEEKMKGDLMIWSIGNTLVNELDEIDFITDPNESKLLMRVGYEYILVDNSVGWGIQGHTRGIYKGVTEVKISRGSSQCLIFETESGVEVRKTAERILILNDIERRIYKDHEARIEFCYTEDKNGRKILKNNMRKKVSALRRDRPFKDRKREYCYQIFREDVRSCKSTQGETFTESMLLNFENISEYSEQIENNLLYDAHNYGIMDKNPIYLGSSRFEKLDYVHFTDNFDMNAVNIGEKQDYERLEKKRLNSRWIFNPKDSKQVDKLPLFKIIKNEKYENKILNEIANTQEKPEPKPEPKPEIKNDMIFEKMKNEDSDEASLFWEHLKRLAIHVGEKNYLQTKIFRYIVSNVAKHSDGKDSQQQEIKKDMIFKKMKNEDGEEVSLFWEDLKRFAIEMGERNYTQIQIFSHIVNNVAEHLGKRDSQQQEIKSINVEEAEAEEFKAYEITIERKEEETNKSGDNIEKYEMNDNIKLNKVKIIDKTIRRRKLAIEFKPINANEKFAWIPTHLRILEEQKREQDKKNKEPIELEDENPFGDGCYFQRKVLNKVKVHQFRVNNVNKEKLDKMKENDKLKLFKKLIHEYNVIGEICEKAWKQTFRDECGLKYLKELILYQSRQIESEEDEQEKEQPPPKIKKKEPKPKAKKEKPPPKKKRMTYIDNSHTSLLKIQVSYKPYSGCSLFFGGKKQRAGFPKIYCSAHSVALNKVSTHLILDEIYKKHDKETYKKFIEEYTDKFIETKLKCQHPEDCGKKKISLKKIHINSLKKFNIRCSLLHQKIIINKEKYDSLKICGIPIEEKKYRNFAKFFEVNSRGTVDYMITFHSALIYLIQTLDDERKPAFIPCPSCSDPHSDGFDENEPHTLFKEHQKHDCSRCGDNFGNEKTDGTIFLNPIFNNKEANFVERFYNIDGLKNIDVYFTLFNNINNIQHHFKIISNDKPLDETDGQTSNKNIIWDLIKKYKYKTKKIRSNNKKIIKKIDKPKIIKGPPMPQVKRKQTRITDVNIVVNKKANNKNANNKNANKQKANNKKANKETDKRKKMYDKYKHLITLSKSQSEHIKEYTKDLPRERNDEYMKKNLEDNYTRKNLEHVCILFDLKEYRNRKKDTIINDIIMKFAEDDINYNKIIQMFFVHDQFEYNKLVI